MEELVTKAYQATETSDGNLNAIDDERERLKTGLQKTLARNCSLRKKDFNRLIEEVLSNSNRNREAIEEERNRVREKVKDYLDEQKQLANYLRQQLLELAQGNTDKTCLDTIISNIKTTCEDKGQILFALLRNFQLHLEAFQRGQEKINRKLQRLVDRGESLSLEELRQLEATRARQDRKACKELWREEVDRLLSHFRQQRREVRRH